MRKLIRKWVTRFKGARAADRGDDLMNLAALLNSTGSTWAARERGQCPVCGHEWVPGEIVGTLTMAFEKRVDGRVMRSPGIRVVDALCVDRARYEGDPSIAWARDAGLLQ